LVTWNNFPYVWSPRGDPLIKALSTHGDLLIKALSTHGDPLIKALSTHGDLLIKALSTHGDLLISLSGGCLNVESFHGRHIIRFAGNIHPP